MRDELLRRLEVLRMEPEVVVDLGAGTGQASIALKRRYPGGRVVAMDIAHGMLLQARKRQTLLRRFDRVVADAAALPLRNASVDMLFSSLMLQWCNDPDQVLRECRRVLRPGGVLHFTTLGPDTLVELRKSWQAADPGHAHVNRFIDMHDLGDALVRAGFAEPVLDVERYTLTYDDARGLMRDLKEIGAHNATAGRARGLTASRPSRACSPPTKDFVARAGCRRRTRWSSRRPGAPPARSAPRASRGRKRDPHQPDPPSQLISFYAKYDGLI